MKRSLVSTLAFLLTALIFTPGSAKTKFSTESTWRTAGSGQSQRLQVVGDFNGDRMADVCYYDTVSYQWRVSLSTGRNPLPPPHSWLKQSTQPALVLTGDFNGDGMDDLCELLRDGGHDVWYVALSEQDGFAKPTAWLSQTVPDPERVLAGSFDGDARADLAFWDGNSWEIALSNGTSFAPSKAWRSDLGRGDWALAGDFNGDGRADIAVKVDGQGWKIAPSTGTGFGKTLGPTGDPARAKCYLAGDFNGDGKTDIASCSSTGRWYVFTSTGEELNKGEVWASDQKVGIRAWAGDFNGDGICDKVKYDPKKGWRVALTNLGSRRIAAVWYNAMYFHGSRMWDPSLRDPHRVPVTGWLVNGPRDTVVGTYNQEDPRILRMDIDAIMKAGFNLIIFDKTNRFFPPRKADWGNAAEREVMDSLFALMRERPRKKRIKIAIAIGAEFWSKTYWDRAGWNKDPFPPEVQWISWEKQYERQREVLDTIWHAYAENPRYRDLYFHYLGKPLVVAYLEDTVNFNPNFPRAFADRRFTIRPLIGYHSVSNTRRSWWFGRDLKRQTPDVEIMTIMPGRHHWGFDNELNYPRENGKYYIESWKEVIRADPRICLVSDWNSWNEEYAIEGSLYYADGRAFQRPGDVPWDWYLQITRAYTSIFKNRVIPSGTYVSEEGNPTLWYWANGRLSARKVPPRDKPVIELPKGWLKSHGIRG